ncbi:tyrosine-type recombinase/integrase [Kiloniella sp. b19]|uniref:tyrosine-type recombinase/integrase n=1 Tax=Kiloniella sp. GXU_MW_B19 TaxID=3141326 RepID=UPI0031E3CBDE
MASIRKRKQGDWIAEVRIKGRYTSKVHPNKSAAQLWAVKKEEEFGKQSGLVLGKTVEDAFERYAREVSPNKKGARWEQIRLQKFCRYSIAPVQIVQVSTDDINELVEDLLKSLSVGSVLREVHLISSVFETARKKWKWIHTNPCRDADLPREPKARDRRISDAEISSLLEGLDYLEGMPPSTSKQFIAYAFLLAIETAMRQGELFDLEWERVFLDQRFCKLLDTKNGDKRDVPLSRRAVELFQAMQPGTGKVFKCSQTTASMAFRRCKKDLKILDLKFHDSRHEALTRLARKIDVLDLARMVGHKDTRSLMIYYNATASEIAQRLD